jgi:AcrR family transcriptional regulator
MPALDSSLSRRERERQMRRTAILDAARVVFAEKGYENATLDEVARRAEFGKGTLYNYFEDGKEGILFAVFDALYDDLQALIASTATSEAVRERSLRAVFREIVENCFDFFLKREDLFFILMKEKVRFMFGEDAEKATYFQRQQHRLVEAFMPALEAAIETGEIKDLPPRAVGHMFGGNINGMLTHMAMTRHSRLEHCDESAIQTPEEATDFLTTMLFDGLSVGRS